MLAYQFASLNASCRTNIELVSQPSTYQPLSCAAIYACNSPNIYIAHIALACGASTPLRKSFEQRLRGHQKMCDTFLYLVELLLRLLLRVRPTAIASLCPSTYILPSTAR